LRNKQAEIILLAVPTIVIVGLSLAFDWTAAVALPLVALSGLLPPLIRLHDERKLNLSATIQAEDQLRETWNFVQRIIDVIPFPVYVKDARSCYILFNKAFQQDKARSFEELIGHNGLNTKTSPETVRAHYEEDGEVLAGKVIHKEEHRNHAITHQEIFRIITKGSCVDPSGERVIVGVRFYITEQRQAQRSVQEMLERETELREQMQRFIQRLIDVIPDPVYIKKPGGRYMMVNDAFAEYRQLAKDYVVSDKFPPPPKPSNVHTREVSLDEDRRVLGGEEILKEERTIREATGEEIFRIVCKRPSVYFDGEPVIIGIDHNITRWKIAERELQRLAQEDALTGLANRRYFRQEAERSIERAERYHKPISLIMLDIDHFKQINDVYGHRAGDLVLVTTVGRINNGLRRSDFAGRWGGEEFVVLLPHTGADEATMVAERLRASVTSAPMNIGESGTAMITVSAGVVERLAGETLDTLIARADKALYQAKNNGRNQVVEGVA
jgi:diguanylate cyclase (GGDEF)-like protein